MTATLEHPSASTQPSGFNPRNGRRAIVRWSLRLYKREWRQQMLTLLLLVVAVAATTVGLGLVGNINESFDLGLRFSFDNLLGKESAGVSRTDERSIGLLGIIRI